MDTENKPEKDSPQKGKFTAKAATVKVSNRMNSPYDLTLTSLGLMWRLEPRGKAGDTVELTEDQVGHADFASALPYIIVSK